MSELPPVRATIASEPPSESVDPLMYLQKKDLVAQLNQLRDQVAQLQKQVAQQAARASQRETQLCEFLQQHNLTMPPEAARPPPEEQPAPERAASSSVQRRDHIQPSTTLKKTFLR